MRTFLLTILLLTFALPLHAAEPDDTKDPVVFVHGYFLGEFGSWSWMTSRLAEEGWPEEYLVTFQFDNVFGCNPAHGYELKAVVDQVLAETGRHKVDIVCHSMGCLDTRYFIKYLCGYHVVRDVVSIAGAHKGSVVACADPFSCGAAQMCVQAHDDAWLKNDFLKDLNWCDITPGPEIKYTSIWSPLDEIIVPQENSIIEGALNIQLQALAEHALILANEETAGYVIAGLNGGGSNNNLPTASPPCYTECEAPFPVDPGPEPGPEYEPLEPLPDAVGEPDLSTPDTGHYETVEALWPAPDSLRPPADLPSATAADQAPGEVPQTAVDQAAQSEGETTTGEADPSLHALPGSRSGGCASGPSPPGSTGHSLLLLALLFALQTLSHRRRNG